MISPYSRTDKVNRSMSSGIKLEAIVQYSRSELLSRTRAFYSSAAMKLPRVEIRFPFFRHLNTGFFFSSHTSDLIEKKIGNHPGCNCTEREESASSRSSIKVSSRRSPWALTTTWISARLGMCEDISQRFCARKFHANSDCLLHTFVTSKLQ